MPVRIPHDWITTLPYAPEASHSHGYKTVGWNVPMQLRLTANRTTLQADGRDVSVLKVEILDKKGRVVPTAPSASGWRVLAASSA